MPRIVHFEINADEPERAAGFYESVFDWKIEKWEGPQDYWLITTGKEGEHGIDGALMRREQPGASVQNIISVPSIDEYMKKVEDNGGKVTTPKMTVPGVGYVAYFTDTEGNTSGIIEEDESAK